MINKLPNEIILIIIKYLNFNDVTNLVQAIDMFENDFYKNSKGNNFIDFIYFMEKLFPLYEGFTNGLDIILPNEVFHYTGDNINQLCVSHRYAIIDNDIVPNNLFRSHPSLRVVRFSKKTNYIQENAFRDCQELVSIKFNDEIIEFMDNAFRNCHSLNFVRLPKKLLNVPEGCFSGCIFLEDIRLNDELETISSLAFNECVNLKEIIIPDNVFCVGDLSFYKCNDLKKITLGKNIDFIHKNTFGNCCSLEEIKFKNNDIVMAINAVPNTVNFTLLN
jgi:hypothetical protein